MVRRIAEITICNKLDQMPGCVPHRFPRMPRLSLVDAFPQNCPRLICIVKYSGSISPAVCRKKQCHGKIFFSVGSRTFRIFTAICCTGPRKIILTWSILDVHICPGPFPQPVKLFPAVHLHTCHHSIGHSLCAHIMVSRILYVCHVGSHLMIETLLLIPIKNCLKCLLHSSLNLRFRIPVLCKHIAILSRLKCSRHRSTPFLLFPLCVIRLFGSQITFRDIRSFRADQQLFQNKPRCDGINAQTVDTTSA